VRSPVLANFFLTARKIPPTWSAALENAPKLWRDRLFALTCLCVGDIQAELVEVDLIEPGD